MWKLSIWPNTRVNILACSEPNFCSKLLFWHRKWCFPSNIVYFSLYKAKQHILPNKPFSCKNGHICIKQAFLTTQSLVVNPFFFLSYHYSIVETHVFHQIMCILACAKQNNTFYTRNLIYVKTVLFADYKHLKQHSLFWPLFYSTSLW